MQDDTQVVVPTTEEGEAPVVVETTEVKPEEVVVPEEVTETPAAPAV